MSKTIKEEAILFDLDDTLIEEEGLANQAFTNTCNIAVNHYYQLSADKLREYVKECARELWRGRWTIDYCRNVGISSWEGLWAKFTGKNLHFSHLPIPFVSRDLIPPSASTDLGCSSTSFIQFSKCINGKRITRFILDASSC